MDFKEAGLLPHHAGKQLIIHGLDATGDSLVKDGWGNVSQQPSNSPGTVPLDTPFLACAPWSGGLGNLAHHGRDWQFTACFQDWLDKWLKQHDGQLYNTDRVTEGWRVTPWQEEVEERGKKTSPLTKLPMANWIRRAVERDLKCNLWS